MQLFTASDPDKYPESNTKDLVNLQYRSRSMIFRFPVVSEKMKYFAGVGYLRAGWFV